MKIEEEELRGMIIIAYSKGWDLALSGEVESKKFEYAEKVINSIKLRDITGEKDDR